MAAAPKGKNQASLFNAYVLGPPMNVLLRQARISFEKWIDIENPKDYPMPRGIVFLKSIKGSFGFGEELGDGIVLYRLTDEQIKDKENEMAKNKEKEKEKLANDKNKDNDNDNDTRTIMENEKEGVKDSGNVNNNNNENDKMNDENEEKKNDDNNDNNKIENNKWSGPCAIGSRGISFGLQIGFSQIDHIIMLPREHHARTFTSKEQFKLGASTELAVANVGAKAQASIYIGPKETLEIQSYSLDAKGLSVGVSVEGSVISVRDNCNSAFYGKKVRVEDIAYGRVNMSDVSKENEDYKRIIELLNKHFTIFRPDPPAPAHHHHRGPPPPHDGAPPPIVGPIVGAVVGAALAGPGPHRGGPHGGPHGSSTFYADGGQRTWNVDYSQSIYAQIGGTCCAHAVASAIRATESRIVGRISDSHQSIVDDIVSKFGGCGAFTNQVLKEECDKRQLKWKTVDFDGALNAILNGGRVVVVDFHLTEKQWENFTSYFGDHSDGVLTKSKLGESDGSKTGGHAACITGANKDGKYWKLKNAWGNNFADNGYFRVEYNAFNFIYYDVYFRQCDLTQKDWDNYKQ